MYNFIQASQSKQNIFLFHTSDEEAAVFPSVSAVNTHIISSLSDVSVMHPVCSQKLVEFVCGYLKELIHFGR